MAATDGQADLFGGEEVVDPRVERAARALWDRDARRSFGKHDGSKPQADSLWLRVRKDYIATARVALDAADQQ